MKTTAPFTKSPLEELRVLYLEDDPIIAMGFVEMIQRLGGIVHECSSLRAALAALQADDYDVALLDLNIHGQTSYAVAEAVVDKHAALVFLTGCGREALSAEWRHHVVCEKPCAEIDVCQAIGEAIHLLRQSPGTPAAAQNPLMPAA